MYEGQPVTAVRGGGGVGDRPGKCSQVALGPNSSFALAV